MTIGLLRDSTFLGQYNALVIFFPERAVPGTVEKIPGGLRDFTRLPFPTPGKIWHLSRVAGLHGRDLTQLLSGRDSNPGEARAIICHREEKKHSIMGRISVQIT